MGHQPGHPVDDLGRAAQAGAGDADRAPAAEGLAGGDAGHVVAAVAREAVVHHLVPPLPVEVDVQVRQLPPLRVEEALEAELVLDRA